ncbi:sarcosine oxidase subunit gamma [Pseudooceanicola spongiae]|uniref:Sarcosine oxidase subunit gamma n=1 Tax=Pseudooceanicola spongiae TaxID=2613965 RepID=A0A7L9WLX2_9RHOB|nr:sarcosine oxidase subunit gamma [Pseudooceanicola spongiae]QOL80717.1 sarcosine oxidase subunit gamma [Pseudooceanicola spongiae]
MADLTLTAQNALPQGDVAEVCGTSIRVPPMRPLTSLMPGASQGLGQALKKHHGLTLPEPGQRTLSDTAECLWFGHRQYLLVGVRPADSLTEVATLTDQSDAWSTVLLDGPLARDVLARLCPLDLRDAAFPMHATARSEIRHMMACITRVSADGFRLMVFRSMADTLLHDLREALAMRAARENL